MVRIVICRRDHQIQVNLTDGAAIWSKKRYQTAPHALRAVARHLVAGHALAYPPAYRALAHEAAGDRRDLPAVLPVQ